MAFMTLRGLALLALLFHAGASWADPLLQQGEHIFRSRCVVCHGVNADGRSDLARIMRPPPANLRASKLDDDARAAIVRKGGEAVGRSSNMPVWESELSQDEIRAVVAYVGTLKAHAP
ncbi:cytochrome c [Aquabacterium sp.]|uniref:c-type cytochrome n=1 Tax=Aquabacterium sp. TaxID=1872578 RepID=UPI0025C5A195|nr:cytochrome c [Aquabacterium sp.]